MIFVYIVVGILIVFSFGLGIYVSLLDRKDKKNVLLNKDDNSKDVLETMNLSKESVDAIKDADAKEKVVDDDDLEVVKFSARKNNNTSEVVDDVDDVFNRIESNINSNIETSNDSHSEETVNEKEKDSDEEEIEVL